MEANYSAEKFQNVDIALNNIISINNIDPDDFEDYDFDYDPNEIYFSLLENEDLIK